jgi:hypothetical protein
MITKINCKQFRGTSGIWNCVMGGDCDGGIMTVHPTPCGSPCSRVKSLHLISPSQHISFHCSFFMVVVVEWRKAFVGMETCQATPESHGGWGGAYALARFWCQFRIRGFGWRRYGINYMVSSNATRRKDPTSLARKITPKDQRMK